ncbi:stage V sporulation protein SpoVS [Puniceicoccus vermicola]
MVIAISKSWAPCGCVDLRCVPAGTQLKLLSYGKTLDRGIPAQLQLRGIAGRSSLLSVQERIWSGMAIAISKSSASRGCVDLGCVPAGTQLKLLSYWKTLDRDGPTQHQLRVIAV